MKCTVVTSSSLHRSRSGAIVLRAILTAALLASAVVLAPEDPGVQASICQRHHSSDVCRVW
ncbi:serine protease inhibitor [Synechococcus sp. MU1643]|nr:serine protease inhibitor [Synechococcus sp. MU1643]